VYLAAGEPEAFSCAPGPAGWRYVSDTLDLAVDSRFGVVRFEVRAPPWAVRGGRAVLDDGSRVLGWAGADGAERHTTAVAVDGVSPGHLVALCRMVAGPGESPVRRALQVLRVEPPSLGALVVRRVVSRVSAQEHAAPVGALLVETWHVDDPDAGVRREVHLAGDVVLAATGGHDGDVELTELESPPSALAPR
jgi:hypothetical protein